MRRRMDDGFVLMQIWIFDPKIRPLDDRQYKLMGDRFGTHSIPLHVIVDGEGRELARLEYRADLGEADYLAFLDRGADAWTKASKPSKK